MRILELLDAATDGSPSSMLENKPPSKGEWKFLFIALSIAVLLGFGFMLSVTDYSVMDILDITWEMGSLCFTPCGLIFLGIVSLWGYLRWKYSWLVI